MGTYEDVTFTFRPDSRSLESVAEDCRALRDETPIDDLPAGDWDPDRERYRETNFERDRLAIEIDEDRQQVYVAGRTHTPACQRAWRAWFVDGGIGDGTLAIVLGHEVDYEGFGWVYEWDDDASEYRPIVDGTETYAHIDGETGGSGAIAAHRIADIADVRPARSQSGRLIRWGGSAPRDSGFIPDFYFESRDDPPDPR